MWIAGLKWGGDLLSPTSTNESERQTSSAVDGFQLKKV